ncbi:hypothetical protein T09_10857 [Trichinella sp. T9]|nr:hypothetical protein T09_10857 [Trichinella sp. T9]
MQETTLWQPNSSLSIPVDRFTRKSVQCKLVTVIQGSRQNRIHSPTPPPTLYIHGSPPTVECANVNDSQVENCSQKSPNYKMKVLSNIIKSEEMLKKNKLKCSTAQSWGCHAIEQASGRNLPQRDVLLHFSFQKPLAFKLGSEKHRKAALWNSCVPALPQASSNQSSCSDQTTVNRQKPTILILSFFHHSSYILRLLPKSDEILSNANH